MESPWEHGLPMLVADREYAHETVGTDDGVTFFDPNDAPARARMLKDLVEGRSRFGSAQAPNAGQVPSLVGWEELVRSVCDLQECIS